MIAGPYLEQSGTAEQEEWSLTVAGMERGAELLLEIARDERHHLGEEDRVIVALVRAALLGLTAARIEGRVNLVPT